MDEQERVELRPRFSESRAGSDRLPVVTFVSEEAAFVCADIKHRSTDHNSSLMMSESELDSDQDTVFSRDRPVRSRNRLGAPGAHNGHVSAEGITDLW